MMFVKAVALWLSIGVVYTLMFELLVQKHYARKGGREQFEREDNGRVMPTDLRWFMFFVTTITWPWWVWREGRGRLQDRG